MSSAATTRKNGSPNSTAAKSEAPTTVAAMVASASMRHDIFVSATVIRLPVETALKCSAPPQGISVMPFTAQAVRQILAASLMDGGGAFFAANHSRLTIPAGVPFESVTVNMMRSSDLTDLNR